MATASQIQALYVGYLGRAADQAGLDFWTSAINTGKSTIESVALGFTLSPEYKAKYAGLDSAGLVDAIYKNVLGRTADADGKAFWVGEIAKGAATPENLLAKMINSLGTVDQQVIGNKVYVAGLYTAAAGADYDAAAGAKILADVDGTAASVTAALNTLPASTAALTAGLAAVETANANLHSFHAALDLNFDGKADYTAADAKAVGFDAAASTALAGALSDAKTAAHVTGTTAAQIDAELALTKANLDAQLTADQKVLADLNTQLSNFGKTTDGAGASAAVSTYLAADEANTAAGKAAVLSQASLDAAQLKLETLSGATVDAVTVGQNVTLNTGAVTLATYDSVSKTYVLGSGITEAKYVGVTGYVAALNEDVAADKAVTVALDKLAAATASVNAFTADVDPNTVGVQTLKSLADTIKGENTTIAADNKAIADNNSAVATYKQLVAVDAQQTALEKAVTDATATMDKAGYAVTQLDGATHLASAGSDAFIFADKNDSISGFGLQGKDVLFVGADYALNTGAVATAGNNSALEVFFTQGATAADSKVVIETSAFGSNAATPEVATIDLTGVSVDHLSFANGYVQVV